MESPRVGSRFPGGEPRRAWPRAPSRVRGTWGRLFLAGFALGGGAACEAAPSPARPSSCSGLASSCTASTPIACRARCSSLARRSRSSCCAGRSVPPRACGDRRRVVGGLWFLYGVLAVVSCSGCRTGAPGSGVPRGRRLRPRRPRRVPPGSTLPDRGRPPAIAVRAVRRVLSAPGDARGLYRGLFRGVAVAAVVAVILGPARLLGMALARPLQPVVSFTVRTTADSSRRSATPAGSRAS